MQTLILWFSLKTGSASKSHIFLKNAQIPSLLIAFIGCHFAQHLASTIPLQNSCSNCEVSSYLFSFFLSFLLSFSTKWLVEVPLTSNSACSPCGLLEMKSSAKVAHVQCENILILVQSTDHNSTTSGRLECQIKIQLLHQMKVHCSLLPLSSNPSDLKGLFSARIFPSDLTVVQISIFQHFYSSLPF